MARSASCSTVLTIAAAALALSAVGTTAYAAGQISGNQIKDKTLGPNDLLVRVAYGRVDGGAASGQEGDYQLTRAVITAPTKGYLVVTGSSDVSDDINPSMARCWVHVGSKLVRASERLTELDPAGHSQDTCSTSVVIPVSAGSKNVRFMGELDQDTTSFDATTLQVTFVPFNGTGKRPTNAEIASAYGTPV